MAPLTLSLLFPALSAAAFSCPDNQHLYSGCSTCFAVAGTDQNMDFGASSDYCVSGGGNLISFSAPDDIARLGRFLEGLGEEGQGLWVGLRYTSEGVVVDAEDSVVTDGSYFAPGDFGTGNEQTCIGIRNGRFFNAACSALLRFICAYNYSGKFIKA